MTATAAKITENDLTWEGWEEAYRPIENPNNDGYGPAIDDVQRMFETYGDDIDEVMNADQNCVWTLIEGDGEIVHENGFVDVPQYIVSGAHFVNRIGYFITEVPHNGQHIEILLD